MTTDNLDLLIQAAVDGAQIATGRKSSGSLPSALFAGADIQEKTARMPAWTLEEEEYIREHYTVLSDAEIGSALGRSGVAVHVHREREMNLPGASKAPGILTVNRAAKMLGMASCHALEYWFDAGLVPGYKLPGGNMCRLIRIDDFTRWVCNPDNWIYIDIDKITDPRLYRLAHKRLERWGNAWWGNAQVAAFHGRDARDVQSWIRNGHLRGMQTGLSISGRHMDRYWMLWRVLRSDAIAFIPPTRSSRSQFTPAGDKWILRAHDELGLGWRAIAASMNPRCPRPGRMLATDDAIQVHYKLMKARQ
jgi:hypothetical protein